MNYFFDAALCCVENNVASVSLLQKRFGINYPRAARLIEALEAKHFIGPFEGSKHRRVLISKCDLLALFDKDNVERGFCKK